MCVKRTHTVCRVDFWTVEEASMSVGQNVFNSWSTNSADNFDVTSAISAFYEEVVHYSRNDVNQFRQVGHYTQVVWANTYQVGCGYIKYQVGSTTYNYVVCNYGPAGNYVGQELYKTGEACSQCGTMVCDTTYPGLCRDPLLELHWRDSDPLLELHWRDSDPLLELHWRVSDPLLELHWRVSDPLLELHWHDSDPLLELHWRVSDPLLELYWRDSDPLLELHWRVSDPLLELYWRDSDPLIDLHHRDNVPAIAFFY
uniref:SCP domain-containing protein n=1 Tax=Timema shepardi TaxID=629360 RepID=A0A7R9FZB5_TIMSH|nr:unnamed protein product [Timema shepardi]